MASVAMRGRMQRILQRMCSVELSQGLECLLQFASECGRLEAVMSKVASRWKNGTLLRCMNQWMWLTASLVGQRKLMSRVIGRMSEAGLWSGWRSWRDFTSFCDKREKLLSRFSRRLLHRNVFGGFSRWKSVSAQMKKSRSVAQRVVLRMKNSRGRRHVS